ncbi:MAG: histone deacetylase family protein [Rhizobiales bacterium]|nr:histone deacetylase family protein [Hyphomicrobiales bacterium]
MKAVFSALQLGHAPTRFLSKGNIVAYPDQPERARMLLDGARQAGASICAARRFDASVYRGIHDEDYLDFLMNAFGAWKQIEGAGPELMPSLRPTFPPLVESGNITAKAGRFLMDFSCPITAETWKAAEASAMTAITAADLSLKGEGLVYALCRPPGHHAYGNRAGGFCYLNNSALAAQYMRSTHERAVILDIDVHHGNGTQGIFYQRPDVLTVSIHADPTDYYPFYWGGAAETGEGEGQGFNLNLPLPVGSGDDAWLAALEKALERIRAYDPGVLVIALGLDAHETDPLKGGTVTQAGFARIAGEIAALSLPTVIVQEGGYLTEHLSDNLAMFLTAYEGALQLPVNEAAE